MATSTAIGSKGLVAWTLGTLRVVAALMLIASVAINFANIVGRYFLHTSIAWAEEVMLFLMIGSVFLTCAVVGWQGGQIRMDAFVAMLSGGSRRAFEVAADAVLIVVSLFLVYLSWPVVSMLFEFDQRSAAANVPLFLPQGAMPAGFGLMAILVTLRLVLFKGAAPPAEAPSDGPADLS